MTQLMSSLSNRRKKQIKAKRRRKKKRVTTIDTPIGEMEAITYLIPAFVLHSQGLANMLLAYDI